MGMSNEALEWQGWNNGKDHYGWIYVESLRHHCFHLPVGLLDYTLDHTMEFIWIGHLSGMVDWNWE
jgi:hypothetical protein